MALICDGQIVAAAQEERFSRTKGDARFPDRALRYALSEAGLGVADLECVVYYDKPLLKFDRILETFLQAAPRGFGTFVRSMPSWLNEKLFLRHTLKARLCELSGLRSHQLPPLLFAHHHQSHAASAFYPSPFLEAAVLCVDGVGEWATTSVWLGSGSQLVPQWQIDFPNSLGLLYSAVTSYCGFKVNSGEYKLMGLAPYGEPRYVPKILELIDVKTDGTFRLNETYFDFFGGMGLFNDRIQDLFGGPPRQPEAAITQREMDLAKSIQTVLERTLIQLCRTIQKETGAHHLCLAGGVALNCVSNSAIVREGVFKNVWVQPAAGDAGAALGAAFVGYHRVPRARQHTQSDSMQGCYLGPRIRNEDAKQFLDSVGANYSEHGETELLDRVAALLAEGKVVGWVQDRMEFGPRALGARSILADPRREKMKDLLNRKTKRREGFRPFAPCIEASKASKYFDPEYCSPYMTFVSPVHSSELPAITHVDQSARVQLVKEDTRLAKLLRQFDRRTGCSALVNTSLNLRGEPIVCSAEDAYRTFMAAEMDCLVIEDLVLHKVDQGASRLSDQELQFPLD